MKFIKQIILSIVILILLVTYPTYANSTKGAFAFTGFGNGAGTRAMGMNGAYTAISDDSSAIFWNPAGLSSTYFKELSLSYANLYDIDLITNSVINMSYPETENSKVAVALGWNRLQFDFESWAEEAFVVSFAKTLYKRSNVKVQSSNVGRETLDDERPLFLVSCGATLKYLRQSSKLDITSLETPNTFCSARGVGLDAGLMAHVKAKDGRNLISAGIAAQDIPTVIEWNSETIEYMPVRYTIGLSSQLLPLFTVALDFEGEQYDLIKSFRLGVEHWFLPIYTELPISEKNFAIRGGMANELDSSRLSFAGGFGIRWSAWQLDYAYLMDNNGLGNTRSRFTVSVRF